MDITQRPRGVQQIHPTKGFQLLPKHVCKVIEYKKFLGVEESISTLITQAVEVPFLKAIKEDYIGYGGRTPFEMLEHL